MQIVFLSLTFLIPAMIPGCGNGDESKSQVDEQAEVVAGTGLGVFFPDHDQITGLTGADRYRQFDGESLFEYMNGGAEIYLALGFESIGIREYTTTLAEDIYLTIEIYDMTVAKNSKEIFHKNNAGTLVSAGVGEESSIGGGTIEFWKANYLVRIRCDDMGTEVDRILEETALFVEKSLEQPDGTTGAARRRDK